MTMDNVYLAMLALFLISMVVWAILDSGGDE